MNKEWFNWINIALAAIIGLFLLWALVIFFSRESSISVLEVAAKKNGIKPCAFQQCKEAYDAIGEPVLHLKSSPISLQLPDLRQTLTYYGKNSRPDADLNNTLMHFSFTGAKTPTIIRPHEQTFLLYDRKQTPPRFIFSPNNAETSLWIEVTPQGDDAIVNVGMKDETGRIIHEPEAYANFKLTEKPLARTTTTTWEIGKQRVDGTLLARQKARWFGTDVFLERHGGKEYQDVVGKQRIDFGEGDDAYAVFVAANDLLVWDGNRWKVVNPGDETSGKPLMMVKKIDDKLMNFELWDADGKNKVSLNLLKSNEAVLPPNVMQSFKFVSARTRSQFVFEINKERLNLSPHDWLIMTDKGWKKLVTPEEIDAYVNRKVTGLLFIFDAVERRDDRQIMVGTLFNKSRTAMQQFEVVMQPPGVGKKPPIPTKVDADAAKRREMLRRKIEDSQNSDEDEYEGPRDNERIDQNEDSNED